MIDENVKSLIAPELEPGERLLWAERPAKKLDPLMLVGVTIAIVILVYFYPDIPGAIIQSWQAPSYGIFFLTAFLLAAVLWTVRSTIRPSFEAFALTNERVIIRRDIFPRQQASIPIKALDKVKAARHGRYGSIHIFMGQAGLFKTRKYSGSFGIGIPFFTAEGFILPNVREPEKFMEHLNALYPQGASQ